MLFAFKKKSPVSGIVWVLRISTKGGKDSQDPQTQLACPSLVIDDLRCTPQIKRKGASDSPNARSLSSLAMCPLVSTFL